MKKIRRFLFAALLPFVSGCHSNINMPVYPDAEHYLVGNQTYKERITSIDLDWRSGSVTFKADTSIVGASIIEENELREEEKVHTRYVDGKLNIRFWASGYSGACDPQKDKNLFVTFNPSDITTLNLGLTSGTFTADALTAKESIVVSMTSGNSHIGKANAPEFKVNITSGNITVDQLEATKVSSYETSGKISFHSLATSTYDGRMTSGGLDVKFVSLETGSLYMTSGNANITVPEAGASLTLYKNSGSFDIKREHTTVDDRVIIGDGKAQLDISLTSGKATIN